MPLDKERPTAFFTFPDNYLGESKLGNLTEIEMIKILQAQDNTQKIPLLKSLVYRTSKGEHFPKILMSLMNCLTNENKLVKKLSMLCWENIDRYDAQGKLISEAILICNALKTNLEHPNEYIRGAALRCVSKLLDIELLDPILPTIILNLDHHHIYVRRHALMCIQHIASHSTELNQYISHLEDKIFQIVSTEYNQTVRYHALLTLIALNIDRAIELFDTISNSLHLQPGPFIEAVLLLISKSHQTHRRALSNFIAALTLLIHKIAPGIGSYSLPTSQTNSASSSATPPATPSITFNTGLETSVIFSIAQTLLMISSQDQSIKLGLKVLTILLKNSQNADLNRLIIQSLALFTQQHNYISLLAPFVTDILSVLPHCDGPIKEDILDLSLALCSHSNVETIVSTLRREYLNIQQDITSREAVTQRPDTTTTNSQSIETTDITLRHQVAGSSEQQYRHNLFKTLHLIAIRHPTALPTIAPLLSLSISDPNPLTSLNAMRLIREIILVNKSLRRDLLGRLCEKFHQIQTPEIVRGVVWILGEFTGSDVIVPQNIDPNQPFVPSTGEKNDINMLYMIGSFLVHAVGLESFIPQQQLREYMNRMEIAKAYAQSNGVEFDAKEFHQSNQVNSIGQISQPRLLIYNGDTLFTSVYTTALTKILIKIFNFHTVTNGDYKAARPENNRSYQQLHSSIILILTRILKFIPKLPPSDLTSSLPPTPPLSIRHSLAGPHNGDIAAFDRLTEDEFKFYPETSYLGIGADCFERMALNLKVCLYPADFGYIITPAAAAANGGVPETIFATSSQALQQALRYEHQNHHDMKTLVGGNKSAMNTSFSSGQGIRAGQSATGSNTNASGDDFSSSNTNTATTNHFSLVQSPFGYSFTSASNRNAIENDSININSPNNPTTIKTNPTGLKITPALKARSTNIHKPIPIRVLRKNLEGNSVQPNLNIPTYQEDTNLAVTGSKSGNIYQPISASTNTSSLISSSSSLDRSHSTLNAASKSETKHHTSFHQLSGLSDLIYAEAKLIIQMYDIILDITVINLTTTTLQNVSLEVQTSSDLTLAAPAQRFSLAPKGTLVTSKSSDGLSTITENPSHHSCTLRFNVNNTETGLIFGNIACDTAASGNTKHIISIQPVVIDISQYLTPSACLATDYRSMWSEFEWENKVLISTNITNPIEFIQFVTTLTNMHCLTPLSAFTQQTTGADGKPSVPEFIAANLYALSSFGEQALLNISVECANNRLTGCMRVRAKTRGVARSLGDLIKGHQRV